MAGYGMNVFQAGYYFFWIPIIAPLIGSTLATIIYAILIKNHWPDEQKSQNNELNQLSMTNNL